MDVNPADVINSLIQQNTKLRLELATLSAAKKEAEENEKENQSISQEALQALSTFDIR
jgi:predicted FMN-binding regulatory protein PaiB